MGIVYRLAVWSIIMSTPTASAICDTMPDTWAATDALGRTLATHAQVGAPRKDRFVGIFYFLWLGAHGRGGPYDITQILAKDPDAMSKPTSPPWGPLNKFHHWGEPLFGYYLTDDPWVLRKHAQMLSDALVDVVIFDVTNQVTYKDNYMALCRVWSQVRKEGGRTPQIAFLAPFFDPNKVARELYNDLYSKGLHPELWFHWKGKPLMMADPEKVDSEVRGFFTFRKPQPDYFKGPTGPNQWAWLEKHPQHVFRNSEGEAEQMAVGVAQNGHYGKLCTFSEADTYGRSWHNGKKDTRPGAVNLGLNFAEQAQRALEVDPEFVFITGWNEWVAMRLEEFAGVREPVMFCDQFTQEYSRDIEPMKGGHVDNYYYQMVDFIRRFKGARETPVSNGPRKITIDGSFGDWSAVQPEYRDDPFDTAQRDHPGWAEGSRLTNNTGRNDIVLAKVGYDAKSIYFYVRTREPITPYTDPNWMTLLIDTDRSRATGWEGYDLVVNRTVRGPERSVLERNLGGWRWGPITEIGYRVAGCEMELSVPRTALGGAGLHKPLRFDFKWADNCTGDGDIMRFITDGDVAPSGRFCYSFREK